MRSPAGEHRVLFLHYCVTHSSLTQTKQLLDHAIEGDGRTLKQHDSPMSTPSPDVSIAMLPTAHYMDSNATDCGLSAEISLVAPSTVKRKNPFIATAILLSSDSEDADDSRDSDNESASIPFKVSRIDGVSSSASDDGTSQDHIDVSAHQSDHSQHESDSEEQWSDKVCLPTAS